MDIQMLVGHSLSVLHRSVIPSKNRRLSEKSGARSISVSTMKRVVVTKVVSLAGSEIEVPCVSHVREAVQERTLFMALMLLINWLFILLNISTLYGQKICVCSCVQVSFVFKLKRNQG
ncbi:hypothetical protein Bca4012_027774 [Brassica carinata]|uniref:Uncharacterized protein n=1 Tax=Brassica carinata TaxID=52824 RepID=A0A8X7VL01_BRACI|nr:hypothetical protein Bca52824_024768 [Brassica carinata]